MTTHAPEETTAAGRTLAARLRSGDVVLLEGPLGSGKTTFVQGIAEGLGARAPVTSPSFVIVNEYTIGNRQQATGNRDETSGVSSASRPLPSVSVLRHIDLYRLPDPAVDLERIGLPELLADPEAITVVEWADRLSGTLRRGLRGARVVHLAHGSIPEERSIEISVGDRP